MTYPRIKYVNGIKSPEFIFMSANQTISDM